MRTDVTHLRLTHTHVGRDAAVDAAARGERGRKGGKKEEGFAANTATTNVMLVYTGSNVSM